MTPIQILLGGLIAVVYGGAGLVLYLSKGPSIKKKVPPEKYNDHHFV